MSDIPRNVIEVNTPIDEVPLVTKSADGRMQISRADAISIGEKIHAGNPNLCQFPYALSTGKQCKNKPQVVEINGHKIEGFCKVHALEHYRTMLEDINTVISDKEAKAVMDKRMKENPISTTQDILNTQSKVFKKPNKLWAENSEQYDVRGFDTRPTNSKELKKKHMEMVRAKKTKAAPKSELKPLKEYGLVFKTAMQQGLVQKLKKSRHQKEIKKAMEGLKSKKSRERTRELKKLVKKYKL